MAENIIPEDIIKIQKKLATFEKGSRNYQKYTKILAKHIKQHSMKRRTSSHIKTIKSVEKISTKKDIIKQDKTDNSKEEEKKED